MEAHISIQVGIKDLNDVKFFEKLGVDRCVLARELSIDEIYTAIDSGVWNNIIAKSAGMEAPKDPVSVGFWEALDAQLNFVYEHSDSLTLK